MKTRNAKRQGAGKCLNACTTEMQTPPPVPTSVARGFKHSHLFRLKYTMPRHAHMISKNARHPTLFGENSIWPHTQISKKVNFAEYKFNVWPKINQFYIKFYSQN